MVIHFQSVIYITKPNKLTFDSFPMSLHNHKYLIVICGPTAVGKTNLSLKVAKHFNAEIISADSRQFYREMNIGTSKPSADQLSIVPHHFINNLSIHQQNYNAGRYEKEAIEFLDVYFQKNDAAVMVGGSGLFIHAVCSGFDAFEKRDENELQTIRNFLNEKDLSWLKVEVERLDPEYYSIVDTKNPARLKRALEVIYTSGKKYSEQRIGKKVERNFIPIKIGLQMDRDQLYERINLRVDNMMEAGLLEEVRNLYPHRKLRPLQTVGYTELLDYIEDKLTLDEAIALIKQNTRNYAKRQLTWFKKDPAILWFLPEQEKEIIKYISKITSK